MISTTLFPSSVMLHLLLSLIATIIHLLNAHFDLLLRSQFFTFSRLKYWNIWSVMKLLVQGMEMKNRVGHIWAFKAFYLRTKAEQYFNISGFCQGAWYLVHLLLHETRRIALFPSDQFHFVRKGELHVYFIYRLLMEECPLQWLFLTSALKLLA